MKPSAVLRILVTLFFIGCLYFIGRGDLAQVKVALLVVQPLFLAISILLNIFIVGLASVRLRWFFKAYGLHFSLREATLLSFIGIFFNNFLPTAAGGDLVKAYYAYKRAHRKLKSFASVIADRIMGLFSLVSMAVIGLLFLWKGEKLSMKIAVGALFLVGCSCISILFSHRVAKKIQFLFYPLERLGFGGHLKSIYHTLNVLNKKRSLLWKALGLSVSIHLLAIFSTFLLVKGLFLKISIVRLFLVFPLVTTASMLPSLNGLGIREGAFVYFLGGIVGKANAVALSILWLGILIFLSFIGGIVYLFSGVSVSLKEIREVKS